MVNVIFHVIERELVNRFIKVILKLFLSYSKVILFINRSVCLFQRRGTREDIANFAGLKVI